MQKMKAKKSPQSPQSPPSKKRRGVALAAPARSAPVENPLAPMLDGLPWQAFAIVGDKADPSTWQLPHHTKAVKKAVAAKKGYEHTVDFVQLETCSLRLQRYGMNGEGRVIADPQLIIDAARHLAAHYRKAGQQIPTILCALV